MQASDSLPLLSTKLNIPAARPQVVARSRLIDRLNQGLSCSLILVSAPAGSGKTTLLSEWARSTDRSASAPGVTWLSLDRSDDEPLRFVRYLIAALQRAAPEAGQAAQVSLHAPQAPPIEMILTLLINELESQRVRTRQCTLVLDDYHLIENPTVHQVVTFLVDHLPPQIHLVLATRADPPLPIARWRARGQLAEIRAADLRFSRREAAQFLAQTMGLNLAPQDIALLESRTEGWIVGLQMAALSMRGRQDVSDLIQAFGGGHHFVLDYLTTEVIDRQPDEIRRFLLCTSVLDRMCGELCDAVVGPMTGFADSQSVLEMLERNNTFLIALDDERLWYRYHHLFADLLRARLLRALPGQAPALQMRASEWCADHGLAEDAIRYALTAPDVEHAATLIEQHGEKMLMQGRAAELLAWTAMLPENAIASRPHLGLSHAWACFFTGQIEETQARLHHIVQRAHHEGVVHILGEASVLQAMAARRQGNEEQSLAFSRQALDQLPPERLLLRGQAWLNLGLLYRHRDAAQAHEAFAQARAASKACGNIHGVLAACYYLSRVQALQGALAQSAETCRWALDLAAEQAPYLPAAGYAHTGMGELLYEWNQLEDAATQLATGSKLAELGGTMDVLAHARLALACVHRAHGQWEHAAQQLKQVEGWMHDLSLTSLAPHFTGEQIRLWLAQGRVQQAADWIEGQSRVADNDAVLPAVLLCMTQARILLAQKEPAQAAALLEPCILRAEAAGMEGPALQAQLLLALALRDSGQVAASLDLLAAALQRARPEGYVRTILDEGEPLRRLVQRVEARQEPLAGYVSRLLLAFGAEDPGGIRPPANPAQQADRDLPEPLTEQEHRILKLVAAGLSNAEIARTLSFSVNTVKWYLKTIYTKLDVHSRVAAVTRASELNLI